MPGGVGLGVGFGLVEADGDGLADGESIGEGESIAVIVGDGVGRVADVAEQPLATSTSVPIAPIRARRAPTAWPGM